MTKILIVVNDGVLFLELSTITVPYLFHIIICFYRMQYVFLLFLGVFATLRKTTISFVMSVLQSAWNNSSPCGKMFTKFV